MQVVEGGVIWSNIIPLTMMIMTVKVGEVVMALASDGGDDGAADRDDRLHKSAIRPLTAVPVPQLIATQRIQTMIMVLPLLLTLG